MIRTSWCSAVGLLVALALPRHAWGQLTPSPTADPTIDALCSPNMDLWRWVVSSTCEYEPPHRAARIPLFRMITGFLSDPLGLDPDGDDPVPIFAEQGGPGTVGESQSRVQVTVGKDNPFFDFRRHGDPGGIGFYKLHTQYQLVDTGATGLTVGMQAATPAGLEGDGVAEGPTFLSPNLGWFQELGNGAALQAYLCKNIRANPRWLDRMEGGYHYGMAFQYPCPGLCDTPNRGLFFFVEGLGRFRYEDVPNRRNADWELVPGLHLKLSDDFWLSFGAARTGLVTCSWRF
jgi:hypothetical protein